MHLSLHLQVAVWLLMFHAHVDATSTQGLPKPQAEAAHTRHEAHHCASGIFERR